MSSFDVTVVVTKEPMNARQTTWCGKNVAMVNLHPRKRSLTTKLIV